jgi:cytoskeletal protein CcmA (bactofilin family)
MFGSKGKTDPAEPIMTVQHEKPRDRPHDKTQNRRPEPTIIGKNTVIEGTIRVAGPVQVDGHIEGALVAQGAVSVGPTGSIVGELIAEELALGGRIDGKISVRDHLHVAPGATARGELRYGSLQVDRGGVIDGSTLQSEATTPVVPTAAAETSRQPPPLPPGVRGSLATT